jgi:predicted DNA-binding transcriptional regulator AlpA
MMDEGFEFLTLEAVSVLVNRSSSWIRYSCRDGKFPKPLASCKSRWLRRDVELWLETSKGVENAERSNPRLETR